MPDENTHISDVTGEETEQQTQILNSQFLNKMLKHKKKKKVKLFRNIAELVPSQTAGRPIILC